MPTLLTGGESCVEAGDRFEDGSGRSIDTVDEDGIALEKDGVFVERAEVGLPDETNDVGSVDAVDSGSCVLAAEVADPVAPSLVLEGCV